MKKKKKRGQHTPVRKKEAEAPVLKDYLQEDLLQKLKEKKQSLQDQEQAQKQREEEQRLQERKQREKNKSFDELLSESDLDWRKFK